MRKSFFLLKFASKLYVYLGTYSWLLRSKNLTKKM